MPALSRWFLRSALLYLPASLLLGFLRDWPPLASRPFAAAVGPVAVHLLTVGWVTQTIFGVAFWMFPRPARKRTTGSTSIGWFAFAALNTGILLRAAAEPAVSLGAGGWRGIALAVAAALHLAGCLAMVMVLWPRLEER